MKVSEAAAGKAKEIMEANGGGFAGILISFEGGYRLDLVKEEDAGNYIKIEDPLLDVYTLPEHQERTEKATVDYVTEGETSGFKVARERAPGEDSLLSQIQDIIDNEINPSVATHGGVINLLDVEEKRVFIEMGGGCAGCGMADVTLKSGVEARLKELDPELQVVDTTDHASGSNPYYAPSKK